MDLGLAGRLGHPGLMWLGYVYMQERGWQGGAGLQVAVRLFCISRQSIAGHHVSNACKTGGLLLEHRIQENWKRQNSVFPEKY